VAGQMADHQCGIYITSFERKNYEYRYVLGVEHVSCIIHRSSIPRFSFIAQMESGTFNCLMCVISVFNDIVLYRQLVFSGGEILMGMFCI
jgi:hypothetical protein